MDTEGLRELFEAFGPIGVRRMFGGHGLYADGLMFGLATQDAVWIKTDAESRSTFKAAGCRPFAYRRGERVVELSYWSVPEAAMDDPDELAGWARQGLEAARRSATVSRPPKAKASTRGSTGRRKAGAAVV